MQIINERTIIVEIHPTVPESWNVEKIVLVAIYAPANRGDQRSFFQQLTNAIQTVDNTAPMLIIGDFNLDFRRREGRSQHIRNLLAYASPISKMIYPHFTVENTIALLTMLY
jgi:hypothetical protein